MKNWKQLSVGMTGLALAALVVACDKKESSGTGITTSSSVASDGGAANGSTVGSSGSEMGGAKAGGGTVDCEKVVDKIASLNPPDMRGAAERKLWHAMCGGLDAKARECILAASDLAAMKRCR